MPLTMTRISEFDKGAHLTCMCASVYICMCALQVSKNKNKENLFF